MKKYVLNTLLAVVLGIALLAIVIVHTFWPQMIIPKVSVPNIAALSLIALLIEHYAAPGAPRCYICIPAFSAIAFGVLPWAAGYIPAAEIWKLAIGGGAIFTTVTWLYTSATERIASGPAAKAAPVVSALGLYFAAQCLTGFFF